MRLLKQVLSFALDFFLIYVKMTLTQFLIEIYFPLQMIVISKQILTTPFIFLGIGLFENKSL